MSVVHMAKRFRACGARVLLWSNICSCALVPNLPIVDLARAGGVSRRRPE
jgi:hypothetical protein